MMDAEFAQRIIQAADEYHFKAEGLWSQAVGLDPDGESKLDEFVQLVRNALQLYARAYLVLDLIETDDEQLLEELLEIVSELEPMFRQFIEQNRILEVLDGENPVEYSRVFAVAEAVRSLLLHQSAQFASTLHQRFTRFSGTE